MKILLTGHKGFIGSNFLKFLDSHEVSTYEWGEDLPSFKNLDWVIHVGAISSTTEDNVNKVISQNYDFSCWLLDNCIRNGVNLQFSSSASIYGLNSVFKENAPVDPRTPYAWSKYMFEKYVERKNSKILVQMFRYFNVYGPNEDHKGTQASPFHQFKKQAKEKRIIRVFENSENFHRDFIPVEDVIDVQLRFLGVKESGVFNLGTGKTKSFMEIAEIMANTHDAVIEKIPMPKKLLNSYQAWTCADMTKTETTMEKYCV